ncbi:MAG: ROK family protein [Steroidobacteraceae bacterium]|jgi:polyphosphate glucokinase|nr:ROK family protein [Steroidobacteraceae bacterium]
MNRELLGIDVGGSSVKLARVAVDTGQVLGRLQSVPTPVPSDPQRVLQVALEHPLAAATAGPVGLAFPAVVKDGRARTAANVDPSWVGFDAPAWFAERCGRSCAFLNDADAAGLAEMRFGAGRGVRGVVFVLTLGTGIGSAPFVDGHLLPNSELGHMAVAGLGEVEAEAYASARTRTALGLDWAAWVARLDRVLAEVQRLFWPDLFILGGAVSERFAEWGPLLRCPVEVRAAALGASAGAIGAAIAAHERYNP